MDNISRICFALASHETYDIITAANRITQLKALAPVSCKDLNYTNMAVSKNGRMEYEKLMSYLWEWLGHRCVYCGIHEKP